MRIGILEPKDFSQKALNSLKDIGRVEFLKGSDKIDDFCRDKEIIFTRLKYKIDSKLIDRAINLRYICTPTTGLNHIDANYAISKGIKIMSLQNENAFLSNIRATPEHAIGLILSLLRNYKFAFLNKENRKWNRDKFWGYELYKNKIGIIGYGRVGKILATFLKAFIAEVYIYDINKNIQKNEGVQQTHSIEELIEESNIILLCASYSDNNYKFFNKKYIDLLKHKFFINISRGELLDEEYLIKKIKKNHFKGIAIDVICDETNSNNNLNRFLKLTENGNFILTPHIAGATYNSINLTEDFIVEKLLKDTLSNSK